MWFVSVQGTYSLREI